MTNRNLRRHNRKAFPANIRVGWQDTSGMDKFATSRTFDISESGLRFECIEALPLRSDVALRCDKLGLQTRATVRFCERKGLRFVVGVEFTGGYVWHVPNDAVRQQLEAAEMLVVS